MVYTIVAHLYTKVDPTSIEKVKNKLIEAAQIYRKDKETVQWEVMQEVGDPRAFTVVERYERESVSPWAVCSECWPWDRVLGSTVTEVPSGKSVLEDIRPIRASVVGQADWSEEIWRTGHHKGGKSDGLEHAINGMEEVVPCGSRGC